MRPVGRRAVIEHQVGFTPAIGFETHGGGEDGYARRFAIGLFDLVHAVVDGFEHTVGGGGAIGGGGVIGGDGNAGFRPSGVVELLALGEQVLRCPQGHGIRAAVGFLDGERKTVGEKTTKVLLLKFYGLIMQMD